MKKKLKKTHEIEITIPPISNTYFRRNYVLKIKKGEARQFKELCEYYQIEDNNMIKINAINDQYWEIGPRGVLWLPSFIASEKIVDFYSLEELEEYLKKYIAIA